MQRTLLDRLKPAVDKRMLPLTAGFVWIAVGLMLTEMAIDWLQGYRGAYLFLFLSLGIVLFVAKYTLVFKRIVQTNLRRIHSIEGRPCFFSFVSWKSYLLISMMAAMGIMMRHSAIPREYLAVLYLGIGLAMVISGIRYFAGESPGMR